MDFMEIIYVNIFYVYVVKGRPWRDSRSPSAQAVFTIYLEKVL